MMKSLFAVVLLFISLCTLSQEKPVTAGYPAGGAAPLFTATGEEIRRFPSANFLDAVNGLFPWVFSQGPNTNDFLFIVNGFVLHDINGISLYDIEQVTFTRNNLNGAVFPFSRAGIFYITTKRSREKKLVFDFSSQYNVIANKDRRTYFSEANGANPSPAGLVNTSNNENGRYLATHFGAGAGGEKWNFYAGVQWDQLKDVTVVQNSIYGSVARDTLDARLANRTSRFRIFSQGDYRITDKVQAGITVNYVHAPAKVNSGYSNDFLDQNNFTVTGSGGTSSIDHLMVGAFMNADIIPGLRNRLRVEYMRNKLDYEQTIDNSIRNGGVEVAATMTNSTGDAKSDLFVVRNVLDYTVRAGEKIGVTVSGGFSYIDGSYKDNKTLIQTANFPGGTGSSLSSARYKTKMTVVNPQVLVDFDSIAQVYGGYAFLVNKGAGELKGRSNSNPYGGVTVDLGKVLMHKPGTFQFSAFYGDLNRNQLTNNWLPSFPDPETVSGSTIRPPVFSSGVFLLPNEELSNRYLKNRLISVGLQGGLPGSKVKAGVEWSGLRTEKIFFLPVNFPGPTPGIVYAPVLGRETLSGFSAFVSATVVAKSSIEWGTRLNILVADVKAEIKNAAVPVESEPFVYATQIGWQNRVRAGAFSLQVNMLCGLNKEYYSGSSTLEKKKIDELLLNYLQAAYNLPGKGNSFINGASLFVHGRNLLASKESRKFYDFDRYAGVGIDLRF